MTSAPPASTGTAGADPVPLVAPQAPPAHTARLFGSRTIQITLPEAIETAGMRNGVALLVSAVSYDIARLTNGRAVAAKAVRTGRERGIRVVPEEVPLDVAGPAAVFEARIFDGNGELRWLHDGDGLGTAVLLAEDPAASSQLGQPLETVEAIDTVANRYLLWGRPLAAQPAAQARQPVADGWVVLAESRIGLMTVPFDGSPPSEQDYFYLDTVEYISAEGEMRNAAVVEERLRAIVAAPRDSAVGTGQVTETADDDERANTHPAGESR
ncbi:type III-D CRISPR-associated protein Csx19 [Frankia tisae]|uniref:type III-D CRISPR-associated protein Csx19 n=1 Tax=Frankia tisae TaxID=2950104 RepID=UPI0021BE877C|nr:CRISPR-associated protein Csx19 [Frankia tisae]